MTFIALALGWICASFILALLFSPWLKRNVRARSLETRQSPRGLA